MSEPTCTCGYAYKAHEEPGSGACDDFGNRDICPVAPVDFPAVSVNTSCVVAVRMGRNEGETWIETDSGSTSVIRLPWREVLDALETARFDAWFEWCDQIPAAEKLKIPLKSPDRPTE